MADATLVNANITFHTNDEDKDDDTVVYVSVGKGTTSTVSCLRKFGFVDSSSP